MSRLIFRYVAIAIICILAVLMTLSRCSSNPNPNPGLERNILILADAPVLLNDVQSVENLFSQAWDRFILDVLKQEEYRKGSLFPKITIQVIPLSSLTGQEDAIFVKTFSEEDALLMQSKSDGATRIKSSALSSLKRGIRQYQKSRTSEAQDGTLKILSSANILKEFFASHCGSGEAIVIYFSDMIELDYGKGPIKFAFKEQTSEEFSYYGINSAKEELNNPNSDLNDFISRAKLGSSCSISPKVYMKKANYFKLRESQGVGQLALSEFWFEFFRKLGCDPVTW